MIVRVRLFAVVAQRAGAREVELEVREGATLGEVQRALAARFTAVQWPAGTMWAVNGEYAGVEVGLRSGDEVAVIPPVSGG